MIGLVLVTHGRLALELVSALEHVVGKQEHISTICIYFPGGRYGGEKS